MNSLRLWLVTKIFAFLPPTRFYSLKAKFLAWAGADISKTARLVSSTRIVGVGQLKIGDDTFVGHEVFISCSPPGIVIGSYVDIAPRVTIVNGTHEIDMIGDHSAGIGRCLPIKIENGAWVGAGSIILPGVTICEKAIIGAGSVVSQNIPSHTISVGIPCRPIKRWDLEKNTFVVVSNVK